MRNLLHLRQGWVMMRIILNSANIPLEKEPGMKDIYNLIRQKEADLERIQHELEALRLSARLLEEDTRSTAATTSPSAASAVFSTPAKPQTGAQPSATPAAWASAKQFP
jgi:hypothetical protein